MISSLETFFDEARRTLQAFDTWVSPFDVAAVADHLCYKCADAKEFERIRSFFERPDGYLYQSWISGRRIAVIKFAPALMTRLGPISVLELSDQKPDGSQQSGFDHVEIFPGSGSVEELLASFAARGAEFAKVARPHHTTYDATVAPGFKVKIESEPLIEKIRREEMGS